MIALPGPDGTGMTWITLAGSDQNSLAGKFSSAVAYFKNSNDHSVLDPFVGKSLIDVSGKEWRLETSPRRAAPTNGPEKQGPRILSSDFKSRNCSMKNIQSGLPRSRLATEQELAVEKQREKRRWRLPEDHGACMICGWYDPLSLEPHHIGKQLLKSCTVPACKNHHTILSAKQEHRRHRMPEQGKASARPLACFLYDAADFIEVLGCHTGCISPEDQAAIEILHHLGDMAAEDGAEGAFRVAVNNATAWFSSLVDQITLNLTSGKDPGHVGDQLHTESRRLLPEPRVRPSSDEAAKCDLMPIYVRTIPLPEPEKERKPRAKTRSRRPSRYVVVFDAETTICQTQSLRLGTYQVFKDRNLIQSGFFYGSALSSSELELLRSYACEHGIKCLSRVGFVRDVLFHFGLKFRARIVGFNLPFDLSRLAIDWGEAQGEMLGGFSLELDGNNFQPRLRIKKLGAKSCKTEWGSAWDGKTRAQRKADKEMRPDRFIGVFVDVSTMAFALTSKIYSLENLCKYLEIPGKSKIKGHGRTLDREYLDYAMEDVRATKDCFFKLEEQLAAHKLQGLSAETLYSPASLGKAYLRAMNIKPWQECQPDFLSDILTAIMNAFHGARSDVRHRREIVEGRLSDFLSMYATLFVLMDLWKVLISKGVDYVETTNETRQFPDRVTTDRMFHRDALKGLLTIVEIRPDRDVLPVRGLYGSETTSIGQNYLISEETHWIALADLVASKIETGRTPEIVRALTFKPRGMQSQLKPVDIFGNSEFRVDPTRDDFFKQLIDLRSKVKKDLSILEANDGSPEEIEHLRIQEQGMKVLASSTSYGIYVEINVNDVAKKKTVEVILDGPEPDRIGMTALETPGPYFHPLIGTLITAGGRLMLSLVENLARASGLGWAFCDTDSMMFTRPDGMSEEDFHQSVDQLQARFRQLNPYKDEGTIFQTEKVNYGLNDTEDTETREFAPLYCYAVCPKRYCLFNLRPDGSILMRKVSEHGLGYLMPPYEDGTPVEGIPTKPKACKSRQWLHDLWHQIVRAALDGHPDRRSMLSPLPGIDSPAMSQWRVTTPEMLDQVEAYNEGKQPDACIRPYNFLSAFMIREPKAHDDWIDPAIMSASPKAPFRKDAAEAAALCFNLKDGKPIPTRFLKTYREAVSEHHLGSESKFLNGFRSQSGITSRRTIIAQGRVFIERKAINLTSWKVRMMIYRITLPSHTER